MCSQGRSDLYASQALSVHCPITLSFSLYLCDPRIGRLYRRHQMVLDRVHVSSFASFMMMEAICSSKSVIFSIREAGYEVFFCRSVTIFPSPYPWKLSHVPTALLIVGSRLHSLPGDSTNP